MHLISVSNESADMMARDTVGGAAFLPTGTSVPACRICGATMALFLQFDIRPEFGLPFTESSHVLVLMCPIHNEIPSIPADYFAPALPQKFWLKDDGHYSLLMLPPNLQLSPSNLDPFILGRCLVFTQKEESVENDGDFDRGSDEFKIGGVPGWINYGIDMKCPCGGNMAFLCQIPDSYGFQQTENAPEQPDSFSSTEYCYMLGNQIFILGCERQCDPRALVAICDN